MTFGEDHPPVRSGAGPQDMAAVRNTAITISRLAGHTNIGPAQRHCSWTPGAALDAVTTHDQQASVLLSAFCDPAMPLGR